MTVLGIDGCRGGWLAAALHDDDRVEWSWVASFGALLDSAADVLAVDIPIGLPESGRRACDVEARRLLGRRASCVYAAPVRAVLPCATYAEARAVLAAAGAPSMSAQAFGLVRAVRDVDAAVTPDDEHRVVETHPELAFAAMAGAPLPAKRTDDGVRARRVALRGWLPEVDAAATAAPRGARVDDALDALACAWVARRWRAGQAELVGDGSRDRRGLVMRIAY